MHLSDFDFDLPNHLIARYPLPYRSASRLLSLENDQPTHRHFEAIIDLVHSGDLLVFNDTKVIPARLFGKKITGGQVEVFVERLLDDARFLAQVRASKSLRLGESIYFEHDIELVVVDRHQQFYELKNPRADHTILEIVETIGQVPLPHYMQRPAEESDKERYQTIYAKHKGSVAAPTAGFHFDEILFQRLKDKDVKIGYLTLHIGAGTFTPIRVEDFRKHQMHTEYFEINPDLCAAITDTHHRGKRVIAVGTTSLRALETASQSGTIQPYHGETNIFIYPGYEFHCVDALITNLHLPRSTLLMLVCAFGGYQKVMNAYKEAVTEQYRFYSYGDAMWIPKD